MKENLYYIFGTEGVRFECYTNAVYMLAADMWNHPSHYSSYRDGSDEAYYEFLRNLWVAVKGDETRLVEIAILANGNREFYNTKFFKLLVCGEVYYISEHGLFDFIQAASAAGEHSVTVLNYNKEQA